MERARHYKRRKEIFDARNSAEKIPTKNGRGRPKEFDTNTADKTGADKSTVRKSRKRADKIDPDVQDELQGDGGETVTPAAQFGYDCHGFEGYLGNVSLILPPRKSAGLCKRLDVTQNPLLPDDDFRPIGGQQRWHK